VHSCNVFFSLLCGDMKTFIFDVPYSVLKGLGLHWWVRFPLPFCFHFCSENMKTFIFDTFIPFGRVQARRDVILFIHLFALLFRH